MDNEVVDAISEELWDMVDEWLCDAMNCMEGDWDTRKLDGDRLHDAMAAAKAAFVKSLQDSTPPAPAPAAQTSAVEWPLTIWAKHPEQCDWGQTEDDERFPE